MRPVKFEQMNCTYTADGCDDLPALKNVKDGHLTVTSVWKPSADELAILNSGGTVCLAVVGGQPPVAIWAEQVNIS